MLLKCCLIHAGRILLRHLIYLVRVGLFCLCLLRLGLFCLYLCNLFFIVAFIFIIINHIISLKQTHLFLFFYTFFRISPIYLLSCQKFSLRGLLSFCLFFWQFQPDVAYKSVVYKKSVYFLIALQR